MNRFEIEDIVSQDKKGIVFRAHDTEKGHTVALRRFFPFGQNGGGLKEEETVAFRIAAQRLTGVKHPALRSVFSGAVDPIDNMPYMVVEWVDGAKLSDVMAGENLDPRLVTQILQLALEVSLLLSEILGEEAVWVETEIDSIFVGSEESERGFVFWLSPFKWLGAEFGSRKLSALVQLGERLAGWQNKLIGDHAGFGLGGWLKWMKNNPDANLAQALEALPTFTSPSESPPPPKPTFVASDASHPAVKLKQPSSISPIMIAACACLLLAVGGLAYFQLIAKEEPMVPPPYVEQTISQPKPAPAPDTATPDKPDATANVPGETPPVVSVPETQPQPAPQPVPETPPAPASDPSPQPTEQPEDVSIARVREMAEKLAREKEAARIAALAPPVVAAPPTRDFTPGDADKMSALKSNGRASVTGIVRNIRFSGSGKTMYFEFSAPANDAEIMAVALKNEYREELTADAFKDLMGKNVRFDGVVYRESTGNQLVKVITRTKITLVE